MKKSIIIAILAFSSVFAMAQRDIAFNTVGFEQNAITLRIWMAE